MNSIVPVLISLAIKASLLLVVAFLATFALRRAPASSRRLVWVLAGGCLLFLPVLSVISSPVAIGHVWNEASWVSSAGVEAAVPVLSQSTPKAAPVSWIPILWASGALAVLLRLAAGVLRIS